MITCGCVDEVCGLDGFEVSEKKSNESDNTILSDSMPEKLYYLNEFTESVYIRIEKTLENLTQEEIEWKPTPQTNNIKWILTHLVRISKLLLPPVINGETTGRWEDQYESQEHSLDELLRDLKESKITVLNGLNKLTSKDFEEEIPLWGGKHKRKRGVYVLLSELIHHNGQIAYIHGAYTKSKKVD